MKSKWYKLKGEVIDLRKKGYSIRFIESKYHIPRSTLSYWFKDVVLTIEQKQALKTRWMRGLFKARKKAAVRHKKDKEGRITQARIEAFRILKKINSNNDGILSLALSMLYLGEGFKKTTETALGNSDPLILKFFVSALTRLYRFKRTKIKCELHLRADQNPGRMRKYWSRQLKLPLTNFTTISIDKRTKGSKTYPSYKGVCVLRCGSVAIQRKLVFLSRLYCDKII